MRRALVVAILMFLPTAGCLAQTSTAPTPDARPQPRDVSLIGQRLLPPPTPARTDRSVLPAVTVADPDRWLENPDDPQVRSWITAQNA
jgi:prolyl oligopeptidase